MSAIKGGEKAIEASHRLIAKRRRGDRSLNEMSVAQIREQLTLAVDRVMAEGGLYDPTLAALAIKQAEGDLSEAIFLLRAFRATLPRFGFTSPVDTAAMTVRRRISTTHKDVPGGQILGLTYDYTHRLLDFGLMEGGEDREGVLPEDDASDDDIFRQAEILTRDVGSLAPSDALETELPGDASDVADLTRDSLAFPSRRDQRLQNLAQGDEGFLMSLCYSSMRGYGSNHPFVGELRHGDVTVAMEIPEIGLEVGMGSIRVTECRTVHLFAGDPERPPGHTRGYGLVFGHGERKAISMAVVDRALRGKEFGEETQYPVQDEEFVLSHTDNVAASGLVQHLKLPHYVDFQAQLQLLAQLRATHAEKYAAVQEEESAIGEPAHAG
ncbi:carbon-phosphorus lyase complex subunit PhnI [Pseudochelatococcus sp. B33]